MKFKPDRKSSSIILNLFAICIAFALPGTADAGKPQPEPIYVIGGTGPSGGIIFQLSDDGKRGLEAATEDLEEKYRWHNGAEVNTNAGKSGIGDGSFNTDRIVAAQGPKYVNPDPYEILSYAALACADYSGGGYGDWYLPAKEELALMYANLHLEGIGGFVSTGNGGYWSSTELTEGYAWLYDFASNGQTGYAKGELLNVRCARPF